MKLKTIFCTLFTMFGFAAFAQQSTSIQKSTTPTEGTFKKEGEILNLNAKTIYLINLPSKPVEENVNLNTFEKKINPANNEVIYKREYTKGQYIITEEYKPN